MTEWINGVKIGATPDAKISLRIPDLSMEGCVSLRAARLMENELAGAVSALLLPTPAFRWEEPSQSFKSSAVLLCEDPRYLAKFLDTALPAPLNVPVSGNSRACGFVIQQQQSGGPIPEGQYISAAAPDFSQLGFADFEDAQASVAARLRAQGIS
jgi:hypothetical protein